MILMKPRHSMLGCILALVTATSVRAQVTSGPEVDAVLAYEHAACAAYLRNDAVAIDSLIADSYTLTDSKGVITTKADDLRDARDKAVAFSAFRNEDMKVRIYGNAAVVTGRTIVQGRTKDGTDVDIEVQFTDTVIFANGRWQLVAGQVARLKPRPG